MLVKNALLCKVFIYLNFQCWYINRFMFDVEIEFETMFNTSFPNFYTLVTKPTLYSIPHQIIL